MSIPPDPHSAPSVPHAESVKSVCNTNSGRLPEKRTNDPDLGETDEYDDAFRA